MKRFTLLALMALCLIFNLRAAEYTLPFSFAASQENLAKCTVIDTDENGENGTSAGEYSGKWFFSSLKSAFKYSYLINDPADDWLILPAVDFGAVTRVKVSFQVETYSDKENFEVMLGHGVTAADMTTTVMAKTDFSSTSFTELSAEIDVPQDGDTEWNLGFHASSPAFRGWIYIKDIKIAESQAEVVTARPSAPLISSCSYTDGTVSASVKMPATDTGQNQISGTMSLKFYIDGSLAETYTDKQPGEDVAISLPMQLTAGDHTAAAVAVQGTDESDKAETGFNVEEVKIVPQAPQIIGCSTNGLELSATVKMPLYDTNGTELSGTLSLACKVDGTVVSNKYYLSAGEEVKFSYTFASAGKHTVSFIAVLAGQSSEETSKEVEAVEPSYTLPFDMAASAETFAQLKVVDADSDGTDDGNGTWTFDSGNSTFKYLYHSNNAANDWIILPMVDLGGSHKVKVSLTVKTGSYPENFRVKLGDARTVSAMTIPVIDKSNYSNSTGFETLSATVEIPENITSVALGIQAYSEADKYQILIKEIKIEDADFPEIIPAAPVIKASSIEYLNYTATVTMPDTDTDGNAITGNMSLEVLVDDTVTETKTECAPGGDTAIALTLTEGDHTIAYRAVLGEFTSAPATETVTAAALSSGSLPFTFTASAETFAQCEVIDIDGNTGYYDQGEWSYAMYNGFKYTFNPDSQADDWLILPLVDFGKAISVKVSVDVKTDSYTESFEICLGRERTAEAMLIPVMKKEAYSNTSWTTLSATVDFPAGTQRSATNEYALGIHAISPADHANMYFNNIKIECLKVDTTGIGAVEADDNDKAEYYNLQGIRVENPESGIYIMRRGGKTTKVIF